MIREQMQKGKASLQQVGDVPFKGTSPIVKLWKLSVNKNSQVKKDLSRKGIVVHAIITTLSLLICSGGAR